MFAKSGDAMALMAPTPKMPLSSQLLGCSKGFLLLFDNGGWMDTQAQLYLALM